MAIRNILVHLDGGRANTDRLGFAIKLAQTHDAHLTGVCIAARPEIPQFIRAHLGPDIIENQRQAAAQQVETIGTAFRETCDKEGLSYEWRKEEGVLSETLIKHTRYVDLIVVGQRDPEEDLSVDAASLPDRVILSAGRPVIVAPYIGTPKDVGKRVLVAWDASRLAARAVNDALPILKKAKNVTVLAVNPQADGARHGDLPGAGISAQLARHGINAEANHIQSDDVDAGDMLLSRAADLGADMIVMGAYGHARLREVVLGGVTRHMLRHMTVPALMSH